MHPYHHDQIIHVTAVTLKVKSLTRSLNFYQKILGFNPTQRSGYVALSLNRKDELIRLVEDPLAVPGTPSLGLYHFALLVPSRKELAKVIRHFINTHYPLSGASDHGVSEAIYLNDPDGNGIEIYRDRDASEWVKQNGTLQMVTEMLDVEGVLSAQGGEAFVSLHPDTTLGHLHLHIADLTKAEAFYSVVLGLKKVLLYMGSALFISDGGYHHHLGLNTWLRTANLQTAHQSGLIGYEMFYPKAEKKKLLDRLTQQRIAYSEVQGVLQFSDLNGQTISVVSR